MSITDDTRLGWVTGELVRSLKLQAIQRALFAGRVLQRSTIGEIHTSSVDCVVDHLSTGNLIMGAYLDQQNTGDSSWGIDVRQGGGSVESTTLALVGVAAFSWTLHWFYVAIADAYKGVSPTTLRAGCGGTGNPRIKDIIWMEMPDTWPSDPTASFRPLETSGGSLGDNSPMGEYTNTL